MNDIDKLLKNDTSTTANRAGAKKFNYSKRKMRGICKSLMTETARYDPAKTVESIEKYIKTKEKVERILYSEISNYIFSLDLSERGIFATNVENLLLYSLNDFNNIGSDTKKIIAKIYDHFQLALNQIENANNIFNNSVDEAKIKFESELKGIQKEYISILGIFATVIIAFVGGIAFSSSVLQNITRTNIYRLLGIVDMLAFVLLNLIYLMVKFIFVINEKKINFFKITYINIICLVVLISIFTGWLLSVHELPSYLSRYIKWCK